jgi:hypothetical protein
VLISFWYDALRDIGLMAAYRQLRDFFSASTIPRFLLAAAAAEKYWLAHQMAFRFRWQNVHPTASAGYRENVAPPSFNKVL